MSSEISFCIQKNGGNNRCSSIPSMNGLNKKFNKSRRTSTMSISSSLFEFNDSNALSSKYWRIPDSSEYLSAIAIHENDPLIAVTSGSAESNLFIYELGGTNGEKRNLLTHHQTISLGGIHSIDWVSPKHRLGSEGNVVATGHNDGYAHLILLPDPSSNHVPAEIIKRFNHSRHVKDATSLRLKNLQLSPGSWSCCPQSALMSAFSENLFLWDPSRSDAPIFKKRVRGMSCFDMSTLRDGIMAIGAYKGISIKDIRARNSGLSPPTENDSPVSCVKWSKADKNLMIAVHDSTVIKVWDIRNTKPMLTLKGHSDRVNALKWSNTNENEFYSGSSDGTIRIWNLKTCLEADLGTACVDDAFLDSHMGSSNSNSDWLPTKPWKLYQQRLSRYDAAFNTSEYFVDNGRKPPSTTIFSNDRQFLDLAASPNNQIFSIDSHGYFGLHEYAVSNECEIDSVSSSGDEFSIPETP